MQEKEDNKDVGCNDSDDDDGTRYDGGHCWN